VSCLTQSKPRFWALKTLLLHKMTVLIAGSLAGRISSRISPVRSAICENRASRERSSDHFVITSPYLQSDTPLIQRLNDDLRKHAASARSDVNKFVSINQLQPVEHRGPHQSFGRWLGRTIVRSWHQCSLMGVNISTCLPIRHISRLVDVLTGRLA
jgi:hypothetical protein